jgi:hypothetical protein
MRNLVKNTFGPLAFFALALFALPALSAEGVDYNSSRSNKSDAIAAPDTGGVVSGTDPASPQGMAINEKGVPSRRKSPSNSNSRTGNEGSEICNPCPEAVQDQSGSTQEIAIDEGGTPKVKGKGNSSRKGFVMPHVLEKSGTASVADSTSADPTEPQGMAINEKGLPGEKGTKNKKTGTK